MSVQILTGDCRDVLRTLPDQSVHCVVTSPPYWGLRDYGVEPSVWGGDQSCDHVWGDTVIERATNHTDKRRWQHTRNGRDEEQPKEKRVGRLRTDIPQGQFCQSCGAWAGAHGLEPSYQLFVEHEVLIFQAVRRVLRDDGTLWLNLGDSYATGAGKVGSRPGGGKQGEDWVERGVMTSPNRMPQAGLKAKDLAGIPWRVAFALQADGWYLRQDIIWSKPNPMPESVTDRCTKAHEYLFLLSKSERYHYDADAIAEPAAYDPLATKFPDGWDTGPGGHGAFHRNGREKGRASWKGSDFDGPRDLAVRPTTGRRSRNSDAANPTRNKRSVWTVATQPFSEAHFATFPPVLIEPCILAGCPEGGTVLDPFGGAGTTGMVADRLGRDAVLIELNPAYAAMAAKRVSGDCPLFAQVV